MEGTSQQCRVAPAEERYCLFFQLENGRQYDIVVHASSATGAGPGTRLAVTPTGVTPQPDPPTATGGGAESVAVSWSPARTDGSPIVQYTVTALPGGRTCQVAAPATSCTVTGLAPFGSYTFSLTATAQNGTSATSQASSSVRTAPAPYVLTRPGRVSKPKAAAGKKSAKVSWKSPTGGDAPTYYRVTVSGGKKVTVRGGARKVTIRGLKKGKKYTFIVTAYNVAGAGKASAKSKSVRPK